MNDWLVMLFLGGERDLLPFGRMLLDEAALVGSSDRMAVVAEIEPATAGEQPLRGPILTGEIALQKIGVTKTKSHSETIIEFVDHSKENYEARNRALILWDHGNGWQNVHVFEKVVAATEVANERDEAQTGDSQPLFVNDLRAVLDEKRDIAVVGFDACLMSMIEIAFQLRDRAQFMVASQHLQPAARGWPYEALLRALTLNPRMEPEELVRTMVDTYAGSYNGAGDAVTLSGLRLSAEVDRAVAAIDSFASALLDAIHDSDHNTNGSLRGDVVMARRHSQVFGNPDYIDIVSFCEQIQKWLPESLEEKPQIDRAADLVKRAIARFVVRHTRSSSASVAHANGVSIYFPNTFFGATVAEEYAKLDFADLLYCRWWMFLKVIVEGMSFHEAKDLAESLQKAKSDAKTAAKSSHKTKAA
jgi:hypothetical protein